MLMLEINITLQSMKQRPNASDTGYGWVADCCEHGAVYSNYFEDGTVRTAELLSFARHVLLYAVNC
jgi:hypothetical protein